MRELSQTIHSIFEAICKRVDLVSLQKQYLKKFTHSVKEDFMEYQERANEKLA